MQCNVRPRPSKSLISSTTLHLPLVTSSIVSIYRLEFALGQAFPVIFRLPLNSFCVSGLLSERQDNLALVLIHVVLVRSLFYSKSRFHNTHVVSSGVDLQKPLIRNLLLQKALVHFSSSILFVVNEWMNFYIRLI